MRRRAHPSSRSQPERPNVDAAALFRRRVPPPWASVVGHKGQALGGGDRARPHSCIPRLRRKAFNAVEVRGAARRENPRPWRIGWRGRVPATRSTTCPTRPTHVGRSAPPHPRSNIVADRAEILFEVAPSAATTPTPSSTRSRLCESGARGPACRPPAPDTGFAFGPLRRFPGLDTPAEARGEKFLVTLAKRLRGEKSIPRSPTARKPGCSRRIGRIPTV